MRTLLWRQHRGQLLWTALVLGAFLIAMVGVAHSADQWLAHYHDWRSQLQAHHCAQPTAKSGRITVPNSSVCHLLRTRYPDGPQPAFANRYNFAIPVFEEGLPLLAVLIGALIGATVVGREIEQRTQLVAWTQSVSRRRWYVTKITVLGTGLAIAGLIAGFANDRLQVPLTQGGLTSSRWPWFFSIDLTPAAEALLAFALAVAIGAWLRRTVAAVGAALVTFLLLFVGSAWVVRNLTPLSHPTGPRPSIPLNGWNIGGSAYHPASQYWMLQTLDVAVVLLLVAAVSLAGWRATRSRAI
ncbi:MAG: hypothetical protein M3070_10330 [Actinomycetota bacterium]|nr:hypothetical protein [Actinomycetota bacterium]